MRSLFLLLLIGGAALAQPFSAGIKAGLPLTDFLNVAQGDSTTTTNRYLFGPEVEVRLPHGLSIEFDALYRHFSYANYEPFASGTIITIGSSATGSFRWSPSIGFAAKLFGRTWKRAWPGMRYRG